MHVAPSERGRAFHSVSEHLFKLVILVLSLVDIVVDPGLFPGSQ